MAAPLLGYEARTWKEGLLLGHVLAWIAAAYCYWIVRRLQVGIYRFASCIPVLALYAALPLIFNRSTHLVGLASFYCILTWIGSWKVLLLCWDTGPGHDPWVASSFPRFAIVMTYPAHVTRIDTPVKKVPEDHYPSSWWYHIAKSEAWYMLAVRSGAKLTVLGILLQVLSSRRASLPLILLHLLLSLQLYLFATIVLEVLAAIANATLGVTLEPHFDNPFAAASLAEFWGRRWNLLVSNILRETIYNPLLHLLKTPPNPNLTSTRVLNPDSTAPLHDPALRHCTRIASSVTDVSLRFDPRKLIAMLTAFLVSGLMHELLVYYATLEATWEMVSFFVVQGIAVAAEVTWKLYHPSARLPRVMATAATLGFAFATAHLLFWPPLDAISEQVAVEMQKMLHG